MTVIVAANAFWNISNFRAGLIDSLVADGWRVVIAAPGADPDWAAAHGVTAEPIAIDRSGLNPVKDANILLKYVNMISRYGAEFFLGYTAKPNIYGSLAANWRGIRAIPNVSGLGTAFMADGWLSRLVGWLYRRAFSRCPIVFFQNPEDRDLFLARKIVRPGQARLLPGSGVDLGRFAPVPSANGAEIRFLFVGRLLGDKGLREFVEAARLLKARHALWQFQLLGPIDPGNRTGIERGEIDRWTATGIIEWLGQADDVRPHLAAATAVVLPSYREGLPRSLLEAAAMARPLIATDVPGNRHLVEHGVNGLLCEPRDPESLAAAMELMGTMDEGSRDAMGRAGRALVENSFGQEQVIAAYRDAMSQLLDVAGVQPAR